MGEKEDSGARGIIKWFLGEYNRLHRSSLSEPEPVEIAKDILGQTKLSRDASYWSGYPANRENYDENDLKQIFDMVSKEVGEPAAYSFANMVFDMPSLAPSNIIRATISLAGNNWVYDPDFSKRILDGNTDIRPVKLGETKDLHDAVAEEFFGPIAAATVKQVDESDSIKEAFRTRLGDDIKKVKAARNIVDAD